MHEKPKTIIDKIWDKHVVHQENDGPAILYIDLHLIHEVTSPQAFAELQKRGLPVHQRKKTFATIDHAIPTRGQSKPLNNRLQFADELSLKQIERLQQNCASYDISICDLDDPYQGIVHVIGPELGLTQPGMTVVCGDSHTATHGAFGCLAFGIGTTEVGHVLATQCLLQSKPGTCRIQIDGSIPAGVTAKDIILRIINQLGVDGGVGFAFEYTGEAIRQLDMEGRMTICNMSIEAGAKSGIISPDEKTFSYLQGKPFAPNRDWEKTVTAWETLQTDPGAKYDKEIRLDITGMQPMVTYGTNPSMSIPVSGSIPDESFFHTQSQKDAFNKAMSYMNFKPGEQLLGKPIDVVFIGSCTNGRLNDLQEAADIFKAGRVAENVKALIVPGSQQVKRQAEALGLDRIFKSAGAEWREPGCSMCIAMNGDQLEPGQYGISTSNRNFEGRQGTNGRTLLASPVTAAASAVMGQITNPQEFLKRYQS